ncbi:uncharacterized protein LOC122069416 isoform X3 [Macadamia integrifolia]|uniref:uncharacterized protein LOC122069416 isoform X3 n=1 Tax=Macadamia integrifolia TaxID=60698 RepID=UPI001C4F9662|nr:uncharacterized protein LOC122069416 isoform X3 [Macadamia integrifolia]
MAANYARRTLLSSPASASKILSECRSSSSFVLGASKVGGFASTKPTSARVSQHKLSLFSGISNSSVAGPNELVNKVARYEQSKEAEWLVT